MYGGSNILQTTLNPEPMMKTNTINNPTGTNTSVTWTQTIYPMALGQMNIYYISIYVVYNGPQSSTAIVIPVSEIPNNDTVLYLLVHFKLLTILHLQLLHGKHHLIV